MKLPISLLLAATLLYCSMSVLRWTVALHTDPVDASTFAAEQAAAKGIEWPQEYFGDMGGGNYQATYQSEDGSGRYATVRVKKTEAGWQLVSFSEGQAEWRKHAASR